MAHTQGPWEVIPNYHDAPAGVQTRGGVVICDVFGTFDADGNFIGQFDNARLIAAAPDMYEAIKEYLEWGVMTASDRDYLAGKFNAAIAKATGQAA